ncbi:MAG TPA: Ycf51 family protein [Trichocoleus sp.]
MLTTDSFLQYAQWMGIAALAFAGLTGIGFLFKWGIRFRLVGATGFTIVLTAGLFALGLVPFTRTTIPGAVRFVTTYDTGATRTVIVVPSTISETELTATLKQAASDLFSFGRLSQSGEPLLIRARTVIHPKPGVSQPLYLGEVRRSLATREDAEMLVSIYKENLAKLPSSPVASDTIAQPG